MKTNALLIIAGLLLSVLSFNTLAVAGPLGSGRYSSMWMLLEKTILMVDVLTVQVVVDQDTQTKLKAIAEGKKYSKGLGDQAATIAIKSEDAKVVLKFKRSVPLGMWLDGVFENLDQAAKAGLISGATKGKVTARLKKEFAKIEDRGYEENDKVIYRVKPGSLEVKVVTADGKELLRFVDKGKDAPGVVLASYFAPESDFRVPLLKSLFR